MTLLATLLSWVIDPLAFGFMQRGLVVAVLVGAVVLMPPLLRKLGVG